MARKVPAINASSMADISFLLLIFFLITTSMDVSQGLSRRLPAPPERRGVDLLNTAVVQPLCLLVKQLYPLAAQRGIGDADVAPLCVRRRHSVTYQSDLVALHKCSPFICASLRGTPPRANSRYAPAGRFQSIRRQTFAPAIAAFACEVE